MAIEYFCCYHSYRKKCEKLTDQELGRLFRALLMYSETGERQELAGRESIAFDFIADDIDRAKEAYEEKCRKNRENGLKANGTDRNRSVPNAPQNKEEEKDKNKDKDKPLKGGNMREKFAPPSLQEVTDYCRERGNGVDPERFVDFYAAKGWKVGNQPMKDWKAAVRTWEKRDEEKKRAQPSRGIKLPEAEKPVDHSSEFARMDRYLAKMREGS